MKLSLLIVTHNISEILLISQKEINQIPFNEFILVNTGNKLLDKKNLPPNTKYFDHSFNNNFPEVKNYGLQKCTGEWILTIDTDELLEQQLVDSIPMLIQDRTVDGYWFGRKTFIDSKGTYLRHGLFYPDFQLRLFRNKKNYKYSGGVHALLPIPQSKTKEINLDLLHYPTIPKYESFLNISNFIPYIKIDGRELLEKRKPVLWYIHMGLWKFITLFFSGYFRGKGFLDGVPGLRAHVLFAASIGLSYLYAGYLKESHK